MSDSHTTPTSFVGALLLAITALAGVVALLFRLYVGRNKSAEDGAASKDKLMADERKAWAIKEEGWHAEREAIRAEFERKCRELAEGYAAKLDEINEMFLAREDAMRKEYGDRVERIASEAAKASNATVEVLNKIHERFIGPRRSRTGG